MSGFQSIRVVLLKDMLLIGVMTFSLQKKKKKKNTVPWTYVISDLNAEEIVGNVYKK